MSGLEGGVLGTLRVWGVLCIRAGRMGVSETMYDLEVVFGVVALVEFAVVVSERIEG
jgi:hypothetical protein